MSNAENLEKEKKRRRERRQKEKKAICDSIN